MRAQGHTPLCSDLIPRDAGGAPIMSCGNPGMQAEPGLCIPPPRCSLCPRRPSLPPSPITRTSTLFLLIPFPIKLCFRERIWWTQWQKRKINQINVGQLGIENKLMLTLNLNQRKNMYRKIPNIYLFTQIKHIFEHQPCLAGRKKDCLGWRWPPQLFAAAPSGWFHQTLRPSWSVIVPGSRRVQQFYAVSKRPLAADESPHCNRSRYLWVSPLLPQDRVKVSSPIIWNSFHQKNKVSNQSLFCSIQKHFKSFFQDFRKWFRRGSSLLNSVFPVIQQRCIFTDFWAGSRWRACGKNSWGSFATGHLLSGWMILYVYWRRKMEDVASNFLTSQKWTLELLLSFSKMNM